MEDEQVLEETVELVECRWCGPVGRVEPVEADETGAADEAGSQPVQG